MSEKNFMPDMTADDQAKTAAAFLSNPRPSVTDPEAAAVGNTEPKTGRKSDRGPRRIVSVSLDCETIEDGKILAGINRKNFSAYIRELLTNALCDPDNARRIRAVKNSMRA